MASKKKTYNLDTKTLYVSEYGFTTTESRSNQMSKIRGKNTKPEIKLRKALWANGIRYRVNYKKLPGTPDIAITKAKIAIFVDGEFWHGHDWENRKKRLKRNREYWIEKIETNMERDKRKDAELEKLGWKVLRFWQTEINKNLERCLSAINKHLIIKI